MLFLRLFSLLLLGSLSLAAALPGKLEGYETVALGRGPQKHLFMQVSIRDKEALFGVDTGAPITVVDSRKARRFGIARVRAEIDQPPPVIMLGTELAPLGVLPPLTARGFTFGQGQVVLADLSAIEQISKGVPGTSRRIDGIIGSDILRSYDAVIDCESSRVYFRSANQTKLVIPDGYTRVPMQVNGGRHFTVSCLIQGKKRRMLVDTGSFGTLFDAERAHRLGIRGEQTKFTSSSGLTRDPKPMMEVALRDLRIGGLLIAQKQYGATDLDRLLSVGEPSLVGILGNDVLTSHRAIIDFGSMNLYLRRPE